MFAYFFTLEKDFMDVTIENQTSKGYENLGTNGGNSTFFQRKKPPNSCKARTVANVLRGIEHMRTAKLKKKNERFPKPRNVILQRLSLSITQQKHKIWDF